MDMLYRAYSNPLDLMNMYINQGRFGKFVTGFLEAEYDRRKAEAEKDEDMKLWIMYVQYLHAYPEKSFGEWKSEVIKNAKTGTHNANKDYELTDDGIQAIVSGLFPS